MNYGYAACFKTEEENVTFQTNGEEEKNAQFERE